MNEVNIEGSNELNISELTAEQILARSTYAQIYEIDDKFEQNQAVLKLKTRAEELGVKGVTDSWNAYKKSMDIGLKVYGQNIEPLYFDDDQPIELASSWHYTDDGISRHGYMGAEIAAYHPLLITTRFENVDSGTEKLELAFKTNNRWRRVIESKSTLASANKIVALADYGISVTSNNAKFMVDYLQELEMLNYEVIPTISATSRLGWINKEEFMPYTENIEFDGDLALNRLFKSVHTKGDEEIWASTIKEMMKSDFAVKLAIAASAASPLLKLINAQPFFVHFWSDMSATGKTLIIMAAASIWGDPHLGEYVQSFNSTTVALERTAEILNNCPMIIDELQLAKGRDGTTYFDVYKLAQGQGRGRGTKSGGIERVPQWCNTIITSGEGTILNENDGQGAYARTLEYEITEILFNATDGNRIANTIKDNYGFGGEKLIEAYKEIGAKDLNEMFSNYVKQLNESGTIQDKQVILASALLVASNVLSLYVFNDSELAITKEQIIPLLTTRQETSIQERAYAFITDWIASNKKAFDEGAIEAYGVIEEGQAYIIKSVFNRVMKNNGFNPRSVLSSFQKADLIETSQEGDWTRNDVQKRVNGVKTRGVLLRIDNHEEPFDL